VRILMISDVYFPRVNGVSTSISVFRREFIARGHQVTLIAPDYGGPHAESAAEANDADIIRIPARRLPLDPEDRLMRGSAIERLAPRLAQQRFDLVHIQTPFVAHRAGVRLAWQLGLPTVETYHTFFEEYFHCYVPWLPKGWLRAGARRFSRRQCDTVDSIVVPSSAMKEALHRYGVSTPMKVLPTGIELDQFRYGDGAGFRASQGIAPDRPTLVYVGRVAFEKNIGFLLQVVAALRTERPDLLLVIAGEGPAVDALKRQAARLGIADNVRFIGYLDRNGPLQACYAAGDAFVFASRTETQGLVLLEAMALGVPVVSTAVMGTRDVVGPGRGALVAEETVAGFAAQVRRLWQEKGLRTQLAEEARRYAGEWSAGILAEHMLAHYGEVIKTWQADGKSAA